MNTTYVLPKDLNDALKNLENAIISSLKLSSFRFTVEFNFEGLKFNKIGITIYKILANYYNCLLYTSPSPRDATLSRMPSSA